MSDWLDFFIHGDFATAPTNIPLVLLGLLLSFLCGHAVAWCYLLGLHPFRVLSWAEDRSEERLGRIAGRVAPR